MVRTAYLILSTALVTATAGFGSGTERAAVPRAIATPARHSGGEIARLARAGDGMFYMTLDVNGRPVKFLVDTGASVVVLRKTDAALAGIAADRDPIDMMTTAGGRQAIRWGSAKRMALTGAAFGPVDVAIADTGLPTSLLGQNFLSRLGSVTIQGDTMIVSALTASLHERG